MASITVEEQIAALQRSQGLLEDDPADRIGPTIPKPSTTTSSFSSSTKTIQKPPQILASIPKPMVTIAGPPIIQRPGIQPVAILPQATHQMVAMQPMVAVAPQPPMHPPPMVEEPTAKRPRTEDQLIPEEEFFATYGRVRLSNYLFDFDFRFLFQGQVTITVQLPIVPEKPEWNLNGQAIPLTLPITDPVRI